MTNTFDRQAFFDKAVKGILEQGELSRIGTIDGGVGSVSCHYRAYKGSGKMLKCAIGHHIPDDKYDPSLEGFSCVDVRVQQAAGLFETCDRTDLAFACELQNVHDRSTDIENFVKHAATFACSYELNDDVIRECREQYAENTIGDHDE